MEVTIQVHPHDVRDEGAETVVKNITQLGKISSIIAETGTLEERHPYPVGELSHNPVQKVIVTDACFEIPHSEGWFDGLSFTPRLSAQAAAGNDYIATLTRAAKQHEAEVLPWLKALNGAFNGDLSNAAVRTYSGEIIPTWLCPNSPETHIFTKKLILNIIKRYPSRAILVDRLRYPDWSGAEISFERMLTCFCNHCEKKMQKQGLNVIYLKSLLAEFSRDPAIFITWKKEASVELATLNTWFDFRKSSISALARMLWLDFRKTQPDTEYWLNLWPPAFASLLGQDYQALGKVCHGAKHFPYYKLGGGADLAALVRALSNGETKLSEAEVFKILAEQLSLGMIDYDLYLEKGLPVEFVREQTKLGKNAFGKNRIFTGIQIWDVPASDIDHSIEATLKGSGDGLFFYCYGWATLEALKSVGNSLALII